MAVEAITFKGDKPSKLKLVSAFKDLCITENFTQEECFEALLAAFQKAKESSNDSEGFRAKALAFDALTEKYCKPDETLADYIEDLKSKLSEAEISKSQLQAELSSAQQSLQGLEQAKEQAASDLTSDISAMSRVVEAESKLSKLFESNNWKEVYAYVARQIKASCGNDAKEVTNEEVWDFCIAAIADEIKLSV